jgi:hypothetical protein
MANRKTVTSIRRMLRAQLQLGAARADRRQMETVLLIVAAISIAIMWHELGHALFALSLTRGPVLLAVGLGPGIKLPIGRVTLKLGPILLGGVCVHDSPERRGDRALIAAAGPTFSIFLAALAWHLSGPFADELARVSAVMALFTLIPLRYPALSGGGDSDGLSILRALFPASRIVLAAAAGTYRPERPLRAPFAVVLGAAGLMAFVVSIPLGLVMTALFGFVYAAERQQ